MKPQYVDESIDIDVPKGVLGGQTPPPLPHPPPTHTAVFGH